jgi:hypothetical protein
MGTTEGAPTLGENSPLWQTFFRCDPYEGFDPNGYPDDCGGWNYDHPIFRTLISALRPRLIIEVGTWKGASAINMALLARELGLPTQLVCIDTWLGTRESYAWKDTVPSLHDDLHLKNGWPQLYYQFLSNVCRRDLQDRILPLAQTSGAGLRLLRDHGMQADLIYIDGSHDFEDVQSDLRHAWDCLAEHGILFGDDYVSWLGVTRAVDEFCADRNIVLIGTEGKFALAKSGNILETLGAHRLIESDGSCAGLRFRQIKSR